MYERNGKLITKKILKILTIVVIVIAIFIGGFFGIKTFIKKPMQIIEKPKLQSELDISGVDTGYVQISNNTESIILQLPCTLNQIIENTNYECSSANLDIAKLNKDETKDIILIDETTNTRLTASLININNSPTAYKQCVVYSITSNSYTEELAKLGYVYFPYSYAIGMNDIISDYLNSEITSGKVTKDTQQNYYTITGTDYVLTITLNDEIVNTINYTYIF